MLNPITIIPEKVKHYPIFNDDNAIINISEFSWYTNNINDENAQISFYYCGHYILGYRKCEVCNAKKM